MDVIQDDLYLTSVSQEWKVLACCANVFLSSSFLSCLLASLSSAISLSLTNFCTFCQPSSSVSSVNQVYLEEGVGWVWCGRGKKV